MSFFTFSKRIEEAARRAETLCAPAFDRIARNAEQNGRKVLAAFLENKISELHLHPTTGYGYGDAGRDALDRVYATAFGAEDALVRHNFISGTHALSTALFGVLRPGDVLFAVTGKPYDTLDEVIGIRGRRGDGSLRDFGVGYREAALTPEGKIDLPAVLAGLTPEVKVVYFQRSRGYSLRPSLTAKEIGGVIQAVKVLRPEVIAVVDNCYGEFVELTEPVQQGADLMIGSLIKNPGGSLAEAGGYIAGRRDLVELCAYRLTSVGIGKEAGASLGHTKAMLQGFFMAPMVVEQALKTAVFAAAFFQELGFEVFPKWNEPRTDIIESVCLGSSERLVAFCQGMQKGAPVDSFVVPEPWDMPGYDSPVIMAAGAFTMGASIELSADAPLREPFTAYLQGGITYPTGKAGVMMAAQSMEEKGLL